MKRVRMKTMEEDMCMLKVILRRKKNNQRKRAKNHQRKKETKRRILARNLERDSSSLPPLLQRR